MAPCVDKQLFAVLATNVEARNATELLADAPENLGKLLRGGENGRIDRVSAFGQKNILNVDNFLHILDL